MHQALWDVHMAEWHQVKKEKKTLLHNRELAFESGSSWSLFWHLYIVTIFHTLLLRLQGLEEHGASMTHSTVQHSAQWHCGTHHQCDTLCSTSVTHKTLQVWQSWDTDQGGSLSVQLTHASWGAENHSRKSRPNRVCWYWSLLDLWKDFESNVVWQLLQGTNVTRF